MVFDKSMTQEYLTVYDYDSGAIWQYIRASTKDEIAAKYPKLKVFDSEPDWFDQEFRLHIRKYNISDAPDEFLSNTIN